MTIGAVLGRLGALALAIVLVVGALVWRGRDGEPPAGGSEPPPSAVGDVDTVRCAAELGACQALAAALGDDVSVVVEDGVTTARALQDATTTEVWVTLSSLVDMVGDARDRASRQPLFPDRPAAVATSPLVLVGWQDRLAVLEQACGVSWDCIGRVSGDTWEAAGGEASWGSPKPAHDAPDTSGVGLLVTAQAAASHLGDQVLSARNLDTPDFQGWFTTLERAVPSFTPSSGSQLVEMVQFGPSRLDVVGTTEAEAADVLTRAGSRAGDLVVAPSSPPVAATVVVAVPVGGTAPDDLVEAARTTFGEAGWRPVGPDGQPVPGATPQPALPSPVPAAEGTPPTLTGGTLEAVLLRWERVR